MCFVQIVRRDSNHHGQVCTVVTALQFHDQRVSERE